MNKKLKIIIIFFVCLLVIEFAFWLFLFFHLPQKVSSYEAFNQVLVDNQRRVVVGSRNTQEDNLEKGILALYEASGELVWEKPYDSGETSTFYAVQKDSSGYVVVGSATCTDEQKEKDLREGILVQYDFDGNKLWEKRYQVLSDTRFYDVMITNAGILVVGQSIYENLEVGNHSIGGGIIVQFDFEGNVLWNSNYGGNKSGSFNAVTSLGANYVVVGKDSKDTGITVVFDSTGKMIWEKDYSYTDDSGFMDVVTQGDDIYVVGSKKIVANNDKIRDTENTDALLVHYKKDGTLVQATTFGGSSHERYQSLYLKGDKLYAVGHFTSLDIDLTPAVENKMTGLLVEMDLEGNVLNKASYGGNNNDNIVFLTMEKDHFLAVGYSESNDGPFASESYSENECHGFFVTFDEALLNFGL